MRAPVSNTPIVLFVCVHNAGRSQMAAGYLQALAGDRIDVRSAGSEPTDRINPAAVAVMAEDGIDIASNSPTLRQLRSRDPSASQSGSRKCLTTYDVPPMTTRSKAAPDLESVDVSGSRDVAPANRSSSDLAAGRGGVLAIPPCGVMHGVCAYRSARPPT